MITYQSFVKKLTQGVIDVILPIQQVEFGVAVTIEAQPDLLNIAPCVRIDVASS